jgi:hypothetical protein
LPGPGSFVPFTTISGCSIKRAVKLTNAGALDHGIELKNSPLALANQVNWNAGILGLPVKGLRMKPKQLPYDFYDWIHARTFAIGAQMVLEPDSQTLPGKPGTIRMESVWTERKWKERTPRHRREV